MVSPNDAAQSNPQITPTVAPATRRANVAAIRQLTQPSPDNSSFVVRKVASFPSGAIKRRSHAIPGAWIGIPNSNDVPSRIDRAN